MKTRISFVALVLGAVLGLAFLAGSAQATPITLVSDTFTNGVTNGYYVEGRTPETNVFATTWKIHAGNAWGGGSGPWSNPPPDDNGYWVKMRTAAGYGNLTPGAEVKGSGACVNIEGFGSYVGTMLHISADLAPRNLSGSILDNQGISLGFFGNLRFPLVFGDNYKCRPCSYFTGLDLQVDGKLYLCHNYDEAQYRVATPAPHLSGQGTAEAPVAFVGTWDTNAFRNLSFDFDTTTGAIYNIVLQGSTANYSTLQGVGFWTAGDATTWVKYAGILGSGDGGTPRGRMDNFQLTGEPIPEPSTLALLGMGLAALLAYAWRKRK
jgi:hypothetical protein